MLNIYWFYLVMRMVLRSAGVINANKKADDGKKAGNEGKKAQ
jgi:hypothetical protein